MTQRRAALRAWFALVAMLSSWLGAMWCGALWAKADDETFCNAIYPNDECQDPWYHGSTWQMTFGVATLGLAGLSVVFLFMVVNSDRARRRTER